MQRSRLLLFTVLAVLVAATSAQAALPPDKALDKPVTLAVKGEALSDVMPMLEKQTGVRLRVSKEIADQKATIFVDDRPLRQVMEGLSTLFGYHWTKKTFSTGDIYELWQDEKSRQSLVDRRQKAWEKAWDSAWAEIEFKAKVADMSKEQRQALREQLKKSADRDAQAKIAMIDYVENYAILAPYCRLFGKLPSNIREMLMPGISVNYATDSEEADWLLSEDIAHELLSGTEGYAGSTVPTNTQMESIGLSFSLGNTPNALEINGTNTVTTSKEMGSPVPGSPPRKSRFVNRYGAQLVSQKVEDHMTPSDLALPRKDDDPVLSRKVEITPADLAKETGDPYQEGSNVAVNRSDILSLLHAKVGLQVISDHYSDWFNWPAPKDPSVKSVLESFLSLGVFEGLPVPKTGWGNDGTFVYMRTKDVWFSDLCEVPNRQLHKWVSAYREQGCLGLHEQADIAALTTDQMAKLRAYRKYMGIPRQGEVHDWPILRLFGLLSEKQRKEAQSGGTDATRLTPEQRKALYEAMPNRGNTLPGGADSYFKSRVGVWRDGDPPPFGTRIDKTDDTNPEKEWQPVSITVREGGSDQPSLLQGTGISAPAIGMSTGAPTNIKYTMTIRFADGTFMDRVMAFPSANQEDSTATKRVLDPGGP